MKITLKLRKKFMFFYKNVSDMSNISKNLLRVGQPILFFTLFCLVTYLYYFYNFSGRTNYFEVYTNAFALFDNIIAGICMLWGGAMFIDYLEKSGERVR